MKMLSTERGFFGRLSKYGIYKLVTKVLDFENKQCRKFGFCFCVTVSIIYCTGAPFAKITNGANNVANRAPVRLQNQTQFIPKMQKKESPQKRCN